MFGPWILLRRIWRPLSLPSPSSSTASILDTSPNELKSPGSKLVGNVVKYESTTIVVDDVVENTQTQIKTSTSTQVIQSDPVICMEGEAAGMCVLIVI